MIRAVLVVFGLVVVVATGLVHGKWTDRWSRSQELEVAVQRLATLPDTIGDWVGEPYPQKDDELALSGAVGHYSRSFRDPQTGEQVLVILLTGKPARMSVHRPEHCYQSAGFNLNGPPIKAVVRAEEVAPAEFFTGQFTRDDVSGPTQLSIFWSFSSGRHWEAPESPRTHYASAPVLYKLYVIRVVTGSPGPLQTDPAVRLLGELLPLLGRLDPKES